MSGCITTTTGRHTWVFLKNVESVSRNGRAINVRLRGAYRCACGATKMGDHDPNSPGDLRGIVEALSGQQPEGSPA